MCELELLCDFGHDASPLWASVCGAGGWCVIPNKGTEVPTSSRGSPGPTPSTGTPAPSRKDPSPPRLRLPGAAPRSQVLELHPLQAGEKCTGSLACQAGRLQGRGTHPELDIPLGLVLRWGGGEARAQGAALGWKEGPLVSDSPLGQGRRPLEKGGSEDRPTWSPAGLRGQKWGRARLWGVDSEVTEAMPLTDCWVQPRP